MFYKETDFKETSIGRVPRDWEVVKLERIFSFKNGQRPKLLEAGKIPVYGANGIMGYTDEILVDNDFTIVVGRVGASGEVHLAQGEIWVSDNAIYSESYERSIVYPPFVYYLLKFKGLSRFASKTTHPIITQTFLNNFQIQLPSTLEQQKIAEIFSTIDEAIQKTNEIIAKTERLKKGLMQELLTKGLILGFMFDTNIFNAILNEYIDLERLPRSLKYYVTHIQYDEICSTQSEARKRELLKIIE
jgi:type I restriction enzyme S subunit